MGHPARALRITGPKLSDAARAEIYKRRRKAESSLMAMGIFGHAARESAAIANDDD